jgi:hypothetical protein
VSVQWEKKVEDKNEIVVILFYVMDIKWFVLSWTMDNCHGQWTIVMTMSYNHKDCMRRREVYEDTSREVRAKKNIDKHKQSSLG